MGVKMTFLKKYDLASLPTRIEKLENLGSEYGTELYIKRDDTTGLYVSGNKIRKLEYLLYEAKIQGCDTVITAGGIQSNHCRATVFSAVKMGFNPVVLLNGEEPDIYTANLLLMKILGAEIIYITEEQYKNVNEALKINAERLKSNWLKPYIIPVGGSNSTGSIGYYNAFNEIMDQEKELGFKFDSIIIAAGSGGTYAGLLLGKLLAGHPVNIFGINVCDDEEYFISEITGIMEECIKRYDLKIKFEKKDINIIDGYVGLGYAKATKEELEFYIEIGRREGIVFDHVYTGKAFRGFINEYKKDKSKFGKKILFIHTGGLFGLFSQSEFLTEVLK